MNAVNLTVYLGKRGEYKTVAVPCIIQKTFGEAAGLRPHEAMVELLEDVGNSHKGDWLTVRSSQITTLAAIRGQKGE